MSVQTPPRDVRHRTVEEGRGREEPGTDAGYVAARVEDWLSGADAAQPASPEAHPTTQPPAVDTQPRRWDVCNPAATRIGRPVDPEDDVDERLRALHAERHAGMEGNDERLRRLDAVRVAQALCNSLDLTAWERDRVLGVVAELDRTAVGRQRAVQRVALVVARRVVDAERRAWLGLDDHDWLDEQPPERLADLSDRLHRLTDGAELDRLLAECALSPAGADRLEETIERELDADVLDEAAFGRSPYRDPYLPPFEHHAPGPADSPAE